MTVVLCARYPSLSTSILSQIPYYLELLASVRESVKASKREDYAITSQTNSVIGPCYAKAGEACRIPT